MKTKDLIERLEKIPLASMQRAAYRANLRLHVWLTGRTHELILKFGKDAEVEILRAGGKTQLLDASALFVVEYKLETLWKKMWDIWQDDFMRAREEAARIAFGVHAVGHERLIAPLSASQTSPQIGERNLERVLAESKVTDGVYDPQLKLLLQVAEQYLYGDGLTLSNRIWNLENDGLNDIKKVLMNGLVNQKSAFDIAKDLEQFLGAGQDCPRWTSTRLYGRTKSEIAAGDLTGLLRGDECDGRGVSYNALRLSRTETQKIFSLATDRMMALQPWVEGEKVNLSPSHGKIDECDTVASGGDESNGTYPKGTIELPLHPNCLCYKTAVLSDRDEFTSRMNEWLKGDTQWAEMDQYAENIGVDLSTSLMPAAISLAVWLFGDELDEWMK